MNYIVFGIILLFVKPENVFGDDQILIDELTKEYVLSEKALWKKIDTQLILLDRGTLLNEIYREHSRILNNDFGDNTLLRSLEVKKFEKLINTVLSIDTNVKNIKDYLAKGEYTKLIDLAKNSATQMGQSAADLNNIIGQRSFWLELVDVRFSALKCMKL